MHKEKIFRGHDFYFLGTTFISWLRLLFRGQEKKIYVLWQPLYLGLKMSIKYLSIMYKLNAYATYATFSFFFILCQIISLNLIWQNTPVFKLINFKFDSSFKSLKSHCCDVLESTRRCFWNKSWHSVKKEQNEKIHTTTHGKNGKHIFLIHTTYSYCLSNISWPERVFFRDSHEFDIHSLRQNSMNRRSQISNTS